ILSMAIPLFFISLCWHRFSHQTQVAFRLLFIVFFSLSFFSYYTNGEDWSVYYLRFIEDEGLFTSFEFGFVIILKLLLIVSDDNFGLAILLYYFLCFVLLSLILKKYKVNEPLFLGCLLLLFGYNLFLEQLRQLLACIIVFYAMLLYNQNKNLIESCILVITASTFHVSAVIILPTIFLISFRNVTTFIIITVSSITSIVVFMIALYSAISSLAAMSFVFAKIDYYLHQNPVVLNFGWLNILDALFILFYMRYRNAIDRQININILTRIIFVGSVIHLFSGTITFLTRVCFYFYFVGVYIYCYSLNDKTPRVFAIKNFNTLVLAAFVNVVLLLNFASYFRSEQAPVGFYNMNFQFFNTFNDNYLRTNAYDKYFKGMQGNVD
ncbi:O103 family O-antigen polymerase, partial [Escherichia coli]|nr:O103 family O-antigen polymerase [Escherichia coli]EFK9107670.1 O103 family O-antigen polymerase [Escherichia coli]EHC4071614.1 O103 family O-antigen polymerase [Escherichia coli]EIH6318944.1 O103 family O-antigen polymerase [Escherichia coli]